MSSTNLLNNQERDSSQSQIAIGNSETIDLTVKRGNAVNLSEDTPLAQMRGKRRNAATIHGQKANESPTTSTTSTVASHERLLKNINKEKL